MPEVIIDGEVYTPRPPIAQDANACEKALHTLMKHSNDYDASTITVRDYLHELMKTLWIQGEGFSGKRPFGNGGWQFDLIYDLVDCGYIPGSLEIDSAGWVSDCKYDEAVAASLVLELIGYAFFGDRTKEV